MGKEFVTRPNSEQWFGFSQPTITFISVGLAAGLVYGALKPIEMYGIPSHHDFHISEVSSTSSAFVITKNFGY